MTILSQPDGWTPEQVDQASVAEIKEGRLPLRAQWRIAEQKARRDAGQSGSFTSDLTVQEFAAIRSVGFSPVGQVMGSAVYNVGLPTMGCGYFRTGGLYSTWAPASVVPMSQTQDLFQQARHSAVARMVQECKGLGGDGVVGVRLTVKSFYGNGLEFMAVGTAVRADGPSRPRAPFTSDLTGQDFAKLIRSGWVPVALVQGVGAMARHNDGSMVSQGSSWFNQEIYGSTTLVQAARDAARDSLAKDGQRVGGHTVILRDMVMEVHERRCLSGTEGEDHLANAFLWGTAIVPFTKQQAHSPLTPLPMLRLDGRPEGSA
jgi:uncharacterized protein YbjQ (UPF0145 family)